MHIALWVSGITCLIFGALAAWAVMSGTRADDAIAGSVFGLLFGALSGVSALVWLVLVIIKAASA